MDNSYIGLDDLVHHRQDCWCARSWCSGNTVDAALMRSIDGL